MKTLPSLFVSLALIGAAFALEPVPQSAMDAAQARISDVKLGMTRTEVEEVLGQDWKFSGGANWGNLREAFYKNDKMFGYEVTAKFQWAGHGSRRGVTKDDTVIELPVLERK